MIVQDNRLEYDAGKDFTGLVAWKKARLVKLFFYTKVVPNLIKEEKYGLNTQIRRASVSTTANIAEGYGRYYSKEGIKFYRISRGSMYELKDHLISCYDLKLVKADTYQEGIQLIEEAKKTLNGYIKYVSGLKK